MAEIDSQATVAANPLQQWAEEVRAIVALHHTGKPLKVAGVLAESVSKRCGEKVEPLQVLAWLDGRDAPRSFDRHDALMHAIGLPHTLGTGEDALPDHITSGPRYQQAEKRAELEALYEEFIEELSKRPPLPLPEPAPHPRRVVSSVAKAGAVYHRNRSESPFVPPRRYTGAAPYDTLGAERLGEILASTENAHEYIAAVRALRGWTRETMAALIGGDKALIRGYEECGHLPDPEYLQAARAWFISDTGTPNYARLEELVIRNRLAIAAGGVRKNNPRVATHELLFMPDRYWQTVLEAHNDPAAWEARADKPAWADAILPLASRGEYLRATRHALGLAAETIDQALGWDQPIVTHCEIGRIPPGEKHEQLKDFLTAEEARQHGAGLLKGATSLFDRARCDILPVSTVHYREPSRLFAEALKQPRAAIGQVSL